jgi:hypothetical protein
MKFACVCFKHSAQQPEWPVLVEADLHFYELAQFKRVDFYFSHMNAGGG